jgi:Gpi18-like mannosyltransferase
VDAGVDYPPGYLLVLWLIGKISAAPGYQLLKLPANLGDLALAWIAGTLADRLANAQASRFPIRGIVIAAVLFNPAVFGLSAGWGQVDSLPSGMILGTFLLLLTGQQTLRRQIGAAVLFGIAFATKPQVALAFPIIAYFLYNHFFRDKTRSQLRTGILRVAGLGIIPLAVWATSGIPFGLTPADLFHQYQFASGLYPVTSVNAFNYWGILAFWRPEEMVRVIGLPSSQFGLLCFSIGIAVTL